MKNTLLIVVGAVVIAGGSFYGGMLYTRSHIGNQRFFTSGVNGNGMMQRQITVTNGVSGTITQVSGNSLSVKLQDGSTKTVNFTSSTPITKNVNGTSSDLTPGTAVIVIGSMSPDGSLNASTIRLGALFVGNRPPSAQ